MNKILLHERLRAMSTEEGYPLALQELEEWEIGDISCAQSVWDCYDYLLSMGAAQGLALLTKMSPEGAAILYGALKGFFKKGEVNFPQEMIEYLELGYDDKTELESYRKAALEILRVAPTLNIPHLAGI